MKNLITFLLILLVHLSLSAQAPGAGCNFENQVDVRENMGTPIPFAPPRNPPNPSGAPEGHRIIYWIHGLGGNPDSWARVADVTAYQAPGQKISGYPARKVDCIRPGYSQFSLSGAGYELHTRLVASGDPICTAKQITDKKKNFLIAHSQGGLVSRAADKYYADQGMEDERRFGGIVTFGTPHLGAALLNNDAMHSAFVSEACIALSEGPIQEKAEKEINIPFFGKKVANVISEIVPNVCNFIGNKVLPFLVEPQKQPISSDYKVGAPALNELNSYTSGLPKVAFYGVEDDPQLWRQIYSFIVKQPNDFPPFEASPDDQLVKETANMRSMYYNKHKSYEKSGDELWNKWWKRGEAKQHYAVSHAYRIGYEWLDAANEKYLAVLGAIQQNTVLTEEHVCTCIVMKNGEEIEVTKSVSSPNECTPFVTGATSCNYSVVTSVGLTTSIVPNDGVVLAPSAAGFNGAVTEELLGSNHQQMRNDANTKIRLNSLFNAEFGQYFKTDIQN